MVEIRFHGRGGQGAVIASKILASALFKEGKYAQSFPAFGAERRGAPVMAFTRFDKKTITRRSMVYEPDHVVVLDEPILEVVDVTAGLKENGWILINTPQASLCFPPAGKIPGCYRGCKPYRPGKRSRLRNLPRSEHRHPGGLCQDHRPGRPAGNPRGDSRICSGQNRSQRSRSQGGLFASFCWIKSFNHRAHRDFKKMHKL